VAVRIRMKMMGRKHRHFFRIVAIDARQPRDGRVIEELGTYDPHVRNTDDRVTLVPSRIKYWLSVGAQPSDHVAVFLKKYMEKWEKIETEGPQAAQQQAQPPAAPAEAAPPAPQG
jgi:small subunit ribosomal protein S16